MACSRLHLAAKCGATVETVEALLAAYPEATKVPSAVAELPLQLAVKHGSSNEVRDALVARRKPSHRFTSVASMLVVLATHAGMLPLPPT